MKSIDRRHFLALGAALFAGAGCQSLLNKLNPPEPTPSPRSSPLATPSLKAAQAAISPIATVAPTPTPTLAPYERWPRPAGGSKLGFHVVFGPRAGLDECLWWCAQTDHPLAVIKCVDDFEAAFKAKRYSERTLTVGRVNGVGVNNHDFVDMQAWEPEGYSLPIGFSYTSAHEAARQYYQLVEPIWRLNPVIDVWETFNEFSWHWPWQADFYIALMDLAEADGYRLGLWSSSAGNPPEEFYPDIARACRRARAHSGHIVCLHEYNLDGLLKDAPSNMVTRYRRLYKYLAQVDAVVPLVISEAGENAGGGFTGVEVFLDDFAWYDMQLSRDNYVIGCAAWTLGDWSGANFEAALPALTEYLTCRSIPARQYLPLLARDGAG